MSDTAFKERYQRYCVIYDDK